MTAAIVKPILESIMVDAAPGDKNVELPAYGEVNKSLSLSNVAEIFKKVAEFVVKLMQYLMNIMGAVTGK